MCGLVGIYSSNLQARHKDALSTLLYLDTFRGRDATGVAALRANADTAVFKSTVPGYEFVEGPKLDQHLRLNDFCWIGHNRFGTIGKNIKTNAHPFMIDDEDGGCLIVGAHNGTVKNKYVLIDHAAFGTDSEALFNNIATEGLEKTLEKVEGAWALTYYDHLKEELRIVRNTERTLFYAFEEGHKTLIWASEMWMLRVACSRHGIKLEDDKVFAFAEDTLYRFPVPLKLNDRITFQRKGGVVGKKTAVFFQDWKTRRPITGPAALSETETEAQDGAATQQKPLISNTPSGTQTEGLGVKPQGTKENSSEKALNSSPDNVTPIFTAKMYKGYRGVLLSRNQISDQLANGCSWCEDEFICINDAFAWLAPSKPICNKCLTGHEKPSKDERTPVVLH